MLSIHNARFAARKGLRRAWHRFLEITFCRRLYLTESRNSVRVPDDPTRNFRKNTTVSLDATLSVKVDGVDLEMAVLCAGSEFDLEEWTSVSPNGGFRRDPAERLLGGEQCLIARHGGSIVGWCWFTVGRPVYIPYLDWHLPLQPHECYEGGEYVHPDYRGRSILHALSHGYRKVAIQQQKDAGFSKADLNFVFLTELDNEVSLRSTYRRGGRVSEQIVRLKLGPWQKVFKRPASWEPGDGGSRMDKCRSRSA